MEMKEKILLYLEENKQEKIFFIAKEVAEVFNIKRNVASHYLNRLVDEGRIIKEETRPVRFLLIDESNKIKSTISEFSRFIGYDGTVKNQIEKCKASVTYPPNGLPLIIRGNSGVGKSYLASLIYRYAVGKRVVSDNAPFVVLNCADYANNSELLSSVLFGYVKGAFTGAKEEKKGLLDEANGGYLFLDEIHNLSSENQEKLFILMDSQKFRRLGESEKWIDAKIRLILATTEDTKSTLLATFRRRIPLEIKLPDFSERSYNERMNIVLTFFKVEAENLDRVLRIKEGVIDNLIMSDFEGNIGEIKSKIKVFCAQAYNKQDTNELLIEEEDSTIIVKNKEREYYYSISNEYEEVYNYTSDILFTKKHILCFDGLRFTQLREVIKNYIDEINKCININYTTEQMFSSAEKFNCYYNRCMERINPLLNNYGCSLSKIELSDVFKVLVSFLYNRQLEYIPLEISERERRMYYKYFSLAKKIICIVLEDKMIYAQDMIEPILASYLSNKLEFTSQIHALILMHGEQNASSIAHLANSLTEDYIFEAFDMPMHITNDELIQEVNGYVEKINTNEGLIVLVDMGSLQRMYDKIKANVDGDLIIMNNVSTALSLDVALKLKQRKTIEQIMELDLKQFKVSMQYYEGISQKVNVIISCISGEGIAIKVKEIMSHYLDEECIDIITMDYKDLDEKLQQKEQSMFKNTVAVLTTTSLFSSLVPIINIEEIVSGSTDLSPLISIIEPSKMKNCINEIIKLFTLEGASERLRFLNPEKVVVEVESIIQEYENYYHVEVHNFLRINLFLHLSTMIERIMLGDCVEELVSTYEVVESKELEKFIKISNDIFKIVLQKYRIKIPDAEYVLIYQILQQIILDKKESSVE